MSNEPISRRSFLRQTGGAGVTALALGSGPVRGANERIRLGFIGVRNQGTINLKSFFRHPEAEVIAVCDVDANVLAAAKALVEKEKGGSCAAYGDYRRLLENKDIDAVVVTTPDHWHALTTIDACAAGKDVYCEKPLSHTVAEGRAMVNAARRHGRIVQTGSQQRSDERFRRACEFVRSGRLGKVHTIRVGIPGVNMSGPAVPDATPPPDLDYDFWLGPAPKRPYNEKHVHYNFRFFWDYSGGQMTNWGAHYLDIAQWGLGMDESGPVSADGTAKYNAAKLYEVPESFLVTYKYANGATLLCGAGFPVGTTFEGDKGTLFVTRGKWEATPAEVLTEPLGDGDMHLSVSRNHAGNWLECIRSRKLPIADVEIGHRSATVCHLGNIAIRSGKKVTWDPKREQIVGNAEQTKMLLHPYRAPWHLPRT